MLVRRRFCPAHRRQHVQIVFALVLHTFLQLWLYRTSRWGDFVSHVRCDHSRLPPERSSCETLSRLFHLFDSPSLRKRLGVRSVLTNHQVQHLLPPHLCGDILLQVLPETRQGFLAGCQRSLPLSSSPSLSFHEHPAPDTVPDAYIFSVGPWTTPAGHGV